MDSLTWKCTICGFVDGGETAPAHCPECGAVAAMFVASEEPPHGVAHNPMQEHDAERPVTVGPGHGCVDEG